MIVCQLPFDLEQYRRDPYTYYELITTKAVEVNNDVSADAHDLLYMVRISLDLVAHVF